MTGQIDKAWNIMNQTFSPYLSDYNFTGSAKLAFNHVLSEEKEEGLILFRDYLYDLLIIQKVNPNNWLKYDDTSECFRIAGGEVIQLYVEWKLTKLFEPITQTQQQEEGKS